MCVCGHMSVPGHMRGLRAQRPLRNIPQERLCGRSRQSPWPQDTAPPESSVAAENTLEHVLSAQPQAPEAWGSSGHAQDTLTRSAWGPGHHPGCAGEGVRALIGKEGRGRGPGAWVSGAALAQDSMQSLQAMGEAALSRAGVSARGRLSPPPCPCCLAILLLSACFPWSWWPAVWGGGPTRWFPGETTWRSEPLASPPKLARPHAFCGQPTPCVNPLVSLVPRPSAAPRPGLLQTPTVPAHRGGCTVSLALSLLCNAHRALGDPLRGPWRTSAQGLARRERHEGCEM